MRCARVARVAAIHLIFMFSFSIFFCALFFFFFLLAHTESSFLFFIVNRRCTRRRLGWWCVLDVWYVLVHCFWLSLEVENFSLSLLYLASLLGTLNFRNIFIGMKIMFFFYVFIRFIWFSSGKPRLFCLLCASRSIYTSMASSVTWFFENFIYLRTSSNHHVATKCFFIHMIDNICIGLTSFGT